MNRQFVPVFHDPNWKGAAPASKTAGALQLSVGVPYKAGSGLAEKEIRRALLNVWKSWRPGWGQLGDVCAPARRGWVGEPFFHVAHDGDLSLAWTWLMNDSILSRSITQEKNHWKAEFYFKSTEVCALQIIVPKPYCLGFSGLYSLLINKTSG